jgi:hypothetical protein
MWICGPVLVFSGEAPYVKLTRYKCNIQSDISRNLDKVGNIGNHL